jgi:hypothetical protein
MLRRHIKALKSFNAVWGQDERLRLGYRVMDYLYNNNNSFLSLDRSIASSKLSVFGERLPRKVVMW